MFSFFLRSVALLLLFPMACAVAWGGEPWGKHLEKHACDGTCGLHQLRHLGDRFHAHDGFDRAQQELVGGWGLSAEAGGDVDMQADGQEHLFLSVRSAHGNQAYTSGLMRSSQIEYGPLSFEIHSTSPIVPSEFRLLVNGMAAHPEEFAMASEWLSDAQGWRRSIPWNCPPLGKQAIQFEVRLLDRLVTSEPLWIEIVPPAKPEVVAVGASELATSPIQRGEIVNVYQDMIVVRFAMSPATSMVMHIQGLQDVPGQALEDCCFAFQLNELNIGRHAIKFSRVVGDSCAMTSEASNTLWIQYEPKNALHSLRNENALRRKAIVDRVRQVASKSRPTFHPVEVYNDMNMEFSPLPFNPPVEAQSTVSTSEAGSHSPISAPEVVLASELPSPTLAPSLSKIAEEADLPRNENTVGDVEDEVEEQRKSSKPVVPEPLEPLESRGKRSVKSHFVLRDGQAELTQAPTVQLLASAPPLNPPPLDSQKKLSTLLREQAQLDADVLNKFEDDLALAEEVWLANKVVSHVIFDAPAYFTQNGYGPAGQEDARNGLVLLEGMELSTQASGHWELKIPYIKSTTPAVLHLQIQFKTDQGRWKPLTLQPICFKAGRPCIDPSDCKCSSATSSAEQSQRCDCSESGQPQVTLKGYSPLLRREVGAFTEVRRRGSVVFGHGYAALEDRRSF